jgi:hypothetical protein
MLQLTDVTTQVMSSVTLKHGCPNAVRLGESSLDESLAALPTVILHVYPRFSASPVYLAAVSGLTSSWHSVRYLSRYSTLPHPSYP